MNTIRLGDDSLDVTLAYLKGKDAESEHRHMQTAAAWRCTHNQMLKTKSLAAGWKNLLEEIILAGRAGLDVFGIENYSR